MTVHGKIPVMMTSTGMMNILTFLWIIYLKAVAVYCDHNKLELSRMAVLFFISAAVLCCCEFQMANAITEDDFYIIDPSEVIELPAGDENTASLELPYFFFYGVEFTDIIVSHAD